MSPPPDQIDGAKVIAYIVLDDVCRPTGRCVHLHGSKRLGPFAGLVIASYQGDSGFYLFACDSDWKTVADTYHDTVEAAVQQAEFEYRAWRGGGRSRLSVASPA